MPYTASIQISTTHMNHRHNVDAEYREKLEHIDNERTKDNIILVNMYEGCRTKKEHDQRIITILGNTQVGDRTYHQLIDEYNEKRDRPSRHTSIEKELEKMVCHRNGTQSKRLCEHEMILQVGRGDDLKDGEWFSLDPNEEPPLTRESAKAILEASAKDVISQLESVGCVVTQAAIHMDETSTHLHLDYFVMRYAPDKKQGLPVDHSNHNALRGLVPPERLQEIEDRKDLTFSQKRVEGFLSVRKEIEQTIRNHAQERGYEIKNPDIKGQIHTEQKEYQEYQARIKKQAVREIVKERAQTDSLREENSRLSNNLKEISDKYNVLYADAQKLKNNEERVKALFEANKPLIMEMKNIRDNESNIPKRYQYNDLLKPFKLDEPHDQVMLNAEKVREQERHHGMRMK